MTRAANPSLEQIFYVLLFGLALVLRFSNLGAAPLTEAEAAPALAAYHLSQGAPAEPAASTAYEILTAGSFALLGSNAFLARFWPALLGSLLAILPFFIRKPLGRDAALLLALALAVDPGLVALSRQASGSMIGLGLAAFGLLAWSRQRVTLAGVLAALALLSGPELLFGLLTLLVGWGLLANSLGGRNTREFLNRFGELLMGAGERWRGFLLAGLAALILLGGAFLQAPETLAGLGASLRAFFDGWVSASGIGVLDLAPALLAYAALPLVFGLAGWWHSWRQGDGLGIAMGWWALAALVLAGFHPGRQVVELIWVVVPLWVLTVRELARHLNWPDQEPKATLGVFGLLCLVFAFAVLILAETTRLEPFSADYNKNLIILASLILLTLVSVLLISLGWSRQVAWRGFTWVTATFFSLGLLATTARFVIQAPAATELWRQGPAAGETDLLLGTLREYSGRITGEEQTLEVVLESDSAALAWTLRDWPNVYSPRATGVPARPAAIISPEAGDQPARASTYRGQSFVWTQEVAWDSAGPPRLLNWLLYRQSPIRSESLVLWLRSDLFPDGGDATNTEANIETDGANTP